MLTCVKTQFQGPSREIGRLLSNMLLQQHEAQTWNQLSTVKARLKKFAVLLKKCLLFLCG